MLNLYDKKKNLIQQWPIKVADSIIEINFIVHCPEILSYFIGKQTITLFYGFLDQDYTQKNPAAFVSQLLHNNDINELNKCYGSFITLHYNINNHKMILANDALGDFAAHYYQTDKKISISDFPEPLLNKNNACVNESRLLHFFAHTKPQTNGCFFSGIKQLNPGTGLILNANESQLKKYYYPSEKINFKEANMDVLNSEFKALMQSAITHQTQGQKKIAVMLSGGMDSSFVAVNTLKVDKKISSFSYVFPNHPQADESRWIDAFRHLELDMHTFSGEPHWPLKPPVHVSINSPILNPYRPLKDVIYHSVQQQNIKFLLTGVFADHLYIGYIYWLVDQIRVNPFKGLWSLIKISQELGSKNGLRQISPLKWGNKAPIKAPWMNPQALKQLREKIKNHQGNKHPHPQQWDLTYGINTAQSNWFENEYAYKHNILIRHPFRDRRVVEFLMALPAYVLGTVKNTKAFVRYAAKDILPDAIIRRKTITTLESFFSQGVLEKEITKVRDLLTQRQCTWQNYIDEKIIHKILQNPSGLYKETELLTLWQCISYELWQTRLSNFKSQI